MGGARDGRQRDPAATPQVALARGPGTTPLAGVGESALLCVAASRRCSALASRRCSALLCPRRRWRVGVGVALPLKKRGGERRERRERLAVGRRRRRRGQNILCAAAEKSAKGSGPLPFSRFLPKRFEGRASPSGGLRQGSGPRSEVNNSE